MPNSNIYIYIYIILYICFSYDSVGVLAESIAFNVFFFKKQNIKKREAENVFLKKEQ